MPHPPGHAQADFGEAFAVIGGVERKIHFLVMDMPHSDACFLKAQSRLEAKLDATKTPRWIAYPYGEYNNALKSHLKENGWTAFGQQSGGVSEHSDFQAIPRFAAASVYSNWTTLSVKRESSPLPVDYSLLPDPIVTTNAPASYQHEGDR